MSVPLPGWFSAEQERPIARPARGRHPRPADRHPLRRPAPQRQRAHVLRQPGGAAPQATAGRREPRGRRRGAAHPRPPRVPRRGQARHVPLPHVLRARRDAAGSVLDDIHDFLVTHPDEVARRHQPGLRDARGLRRRRSTTRASASFALPPAPTAAVADAARDDRRRPAASSSWPRTTRARRPGTSLAYERITEETPYTFAKVAQLTDPAELPASCRPTAGRQRAPLFLINHWISTDPRAAARRTPRRSTPTARCCGARGSAQRIRDHVPNLVAVNFYKRGDLFRVVDTLNGAGGR